MGRYWNIWSYNAVELALFFVAGRNMGITADEFPGLDSHEPVKHFWG